MPGSGQVEQVTVRFQADINQYVQAMQKAKEAIDKFAAGADSTTKKAMDASIKVVQSYSKMAQESGKLAVEQSKVAAAADKAAQAHDRLNNQTNRSTSSMTNMGSALRGAIGQYLSLGIAISQVANVVKEGMDFNKFMEVSTTAFGVMMKSVDGAKAKMKELFDYAVNSPLTFKDVVSASRQLMAYGFSAKELVPTINTLGVVAKATGVQLGDMAYVYGTLRSQGRAYTRDLMQFAMRGIPIYEELAKVVGKPVAELQKMTEAGKIGFAEVEKAFQNMTTGTGRFAGFFDEYMKTYEGKMSMLTDVWQQAMGKLTKGTFDAMKPIIDDLTVALKENGDEFAKWGKTIGDVTVGVVGGLKATGDLVKMVGDAFTWLVKPISDFINLLGGLNWDIIIIAISAIVTAINPLIGGFMLLSEAISLASRMYKQFTEGTKSIKPAYSASIQRGEQSLQRQYMTIAPVVDQAAMEEVSKEIEKMMNLLKKYQDEWAMIQARNLVASEKDIYAVANLENELRVREMKDKLKGYDSILTKALAIQDLIHKDALEKIRLEAEESNRQTSYRDKARAIVQRITGQFTNSATREQLATAKEVPVSLITQDMTDLVFVLDQLSGTFLLLANRGGDTTQVENEMANATSIFNKLLDEARLKMIEFTSVIKDSEEELGKGVDSLKEWSDYYSKVFDEMLNGSDEAQQNIKAKAGRAYGTGNNLQGAGYQALAATQGTEAGALMTGGNPIAILVEAALKFLMSIENVVKVLNPFTTILEGARAILEPLLNSALQPIVDLFMELGLVLGQVLAPFINMFALVVRAVVIYWEIQFLPILKIVGAAFAWLNDYVIVPVGNVIIGVMNSIIDVVNSFAAPISKFFVWMSDNVMTPFTNFLIDLINGAFKAINKVLSFLHLKNLPLLDRAVADASENIFTLIPRIGKLLTTTEAANAKNAEALASFMQPFIDATKTASEIITGEWEAALIRAKELGASQDQINMINTSFANKLKYANGEIVAALESLASEVDKVVSTLQDQIDGTLSRIKDAFTSKIQSLKDLYEVGAITGAEYAQKSAAAYTESYNAIVNPLVLAGWSQTEATNEAIRVLGNNITGGATSLGDLSLLLTKQLGDLAQVTQIQGLIVKLRELAKPEGDQVAFDTLFAQITALVAALPANLQTGLDISGIIKQVNEVAAVTSNPPVTPPVVVTPPVAVVTPTIPDYILEALQIYNIYATEDDPNELHYEERIKLAGAISTLHDYGYPGFATGTSNVPYDMPANIHKGEGIIPATFMDSIRKGDLSLSGGGNGGGINVVVNVQGSVTTENDLAAAIARNIYTQRKRGLLTV